MNTDEIDVSKISVEMESLTSVETLHATSLQMTVYKADLVLCDRSVTPSSD